MNNQQNSLVEVVVVVAVAIIAIGGVVGMTILGYQGKALPEALVAATSGASGALFAILVRFTGGTAAAPLAVAEPHRTERAHVSSVADQPKAKATARKAR